MLLEHTKVQIIDSVGKQETEEVDIRKNRPERRFHEFCFYQFILNRWKIYYA